MISKVNIRPLRLDFSLEMMQHSRVFEQKEREDVI